MPVITIVTGEGSSGGALAIAVSDSIWMLENAVYSILSPEGFASIMWKDAKKAPKACEIMKITAADLKSFGMIDGILPEGKRCMLEMDQMLRREIRRLQKMSPQSLVEARYEKFRKMDGLYKE